MAGVALGRAGGGGRARPTLRVWTRLAGSLALGVATLSAAGAGATAAAGTSGPVVSGEVRAAGAPVVGAYVALRTAGLTGDVTLATTRSGADGSFELDYAAQPASTQLYVSALGGSVHRQTEGPARMLMAALGPPAAVPPSVTVDELTTVAAAFALHQFFGPSGDDVSGFSPGLPDAMATAGNLADAATGRVSTVVANPPNGSANATLATLNTLADVIASCSAGTPLQCAQLFAVTTPAGGTAPANTLQALLAIERNPMLPTGPVFALRGFPAYYTPALQQPPSAWTLALLYTAGGFDGPGNIAVDADGDLWSGNNFSPPGGTVGTTVTVISPTGVPILGSPISGGGVLGVGFGTAIDQHGHVWIGNFYGHSISEISPNGRPVSPPNGFTGGSPDQPQDIAIDQRGDVWIADFGADDVIEYPHGDPGRPKVVQGGGLRRPFGVAVGGDGTIWVTNGSESAAPGSVVRITPDGRFLGRPISGGGMVSPQGIAIDAAGDAWVANLISSSVTEIGPDGSVVGAPHTGGGSIAGGWGIAIDGDQNVWVASFNKPGVTELCGSQVADCPVGLHTGDPISPAGTGFTSRAYQHLTAVAIDPSGNVWAANNWSTGSPIRSFVGGDGLVELVGAATPVQTPMIGPPIRT
jgi:hypothetical protein